MPRAAESARGEGALVGVLVLDVDPVVNYERWADDIEEPQGARPSHPIIADADFNVSKLYGMLPASTSGCSAGQPGASSAATLQSILGALAFCSVCEEDGFLFVRLRPTDGAMTQAVSSAADYRSRINGAVDEDPDQLAQLLQDSEGGLG